MDRNALSLIAALLLGSASTPASAALSPADQAPLQSRIEAARKTLDNLTGGRPDGVTGTDCEKVAQHHWRDHHNHWRDHNNHWRDHHH